MSKRSGEFITLDELLNEVGADAARWYFSSRAYTTGIDFDLELAKRQSNENPVYYVQYAHARASSILRPRGRGAPRAGRVAETGERLGAPIRAGIDAPPARVPRHALPLAADRRETHEVPRYAYELASAFSAFYRDCKVIGEDAGAVGCAARPGRCDAMGPRQRARPAGHLRAGLDVGRRQPPAASTAWSRSSS